MGTGDLEGRELLEDSKVCCCQHQKWVLVLVDFSG